MEGKYVRRQLWSSGGGTQSAAIAALLVRGDLQAPDIAIIVDTERESSATWEYHDAVIVPALASVGVTLERVAKSRYATVDLYSPKGDVLIPAFTNGGKGKLPTYCSTEWKARVVQRRANEVIPDSEFDIWLGISVDEPRRVKQATGKWQYRYPLIERRMNRGDCIALVKSMGWPEPPRSSCWMCPNRTNEEWVRQKREQPADHEKAIAFEKMIREKDDAITLHASGKILEQMDEAGDFDTSRCDGGFCFG